MTASAKRPNNDDQKADARTRAPGGCTTLNIVGGRQRRRASMAVVAAVNAAASRLLTTTSATETDFCQHDSRTGGATETPDVRPGPAPVAPGKTAPTPTRRPRHE